LWHERRYAAKYRGINPLLQFRTGGLSIGPPDAICRRVNLRPAICGGLAFVLLILAGCSSVSARKVIALDQFQRIYVVQRLNENHRLDEIFVAELRRLGREAASGPLTMMPEKTDAILTYDARWEWDFKSYLIELNLELHTTHAHKKLADAKCHQPTIKPRSPQDVIREMLRQLLAK
jgi:hypothetical protein